MSAEPMRVLLIEDNPGDARLIREMLADAGGTRLDLIHVEQLSQGLAYIAEASAAGKMAVTVVLLDLSLPDSLGLETLARFRAHSPRLPIIVLTGLKDEQIALRAMQQGAQDYLVKGQVDGIGIARAIRYAMEREAVNRSLAESESRYRLLAEHMTDTIWLMDVDLMITYISPSVEKLRGFSLAEIMQLPLDKQLTPGSQQKAMAVFTEEMPRAWADAAYHLACTLELEFYRKDGSTVWTESTFSLIRDENGRPTAFLGEARDITERKQAEQAVLGLNAELEQRVVERTAQLEAAVKEMESFSYSVSHDLRAPLRAMNGFSHILLDEYSAQLPPQAQHYLSTIGDNGQRMDRLIDDLLAFSRLNRQPLSRSPFAMSDLVRDALATLSAEQEGRHVDILIGDMPDCAADPALIKQVWINLLSNALKYTRKRPLARIEVGHLQDANGAPGCYIRDNGVGFDMRYADKLFGVFQRLHSGEEYEGTGVGLAIVQHIVQRHGGRVWAEAEVDKGATFYFTLGEDEAAPDAPLSSSNGVCRANMSRSMNHRR